MFARWSSTKLFEFEISFQIIRNVEEGNWISTDAEINKTNEVIEIKLKTRIQEQIVAFSQASVDLEPS